MRRRHSVLIALSTAGKPTPIESFPPFEEGYQQSALERSIAPYRLASENSPLERRRDRVESHTLYVHHGNSVHYRHLGSPASSTALLSRGVCKRSVELAGEE